MNIQRLKFAQARGACFQLDYSMLGYKGDAGLWRNVGWAPPDLMLSRPGWYRIAPDDAHLEYGEIARTALSMAEGMGGAGYRDAPYTDFAKDWPLGIAIQLGAGSYEDDMTLDEEILYLLFLAEFLADEGL